MCGLEIQLREGEAWLLFPCALAGQLAVCESLAASEYLVCGGVMSQDLKNSDLI